MPAQNVEIKNFVGLYLNRNSFTVPDGALEKASNTIITRDFVVEKRNGFKTFLTPGGGAELNGLYNFQDVLMAVYRTKVEWLNSSGTPTTLSGATVTLSSPRVVKFAESNKNLYFTSDNGPLKLEAYNSTIWNAGVPPALDIIGTLAPANGPIGGDTQVSYRIVFIRMDTNSNLLLGAPSDFLTLVSRKIVGASWARVTNVATVTTSSPHNLSTGMIITTSNSTGATPITNNDYTITVTSATTFTFANTAANSSGTVDYTSTRNVNLEASIPSEINSTAYSYQIYRSSQSANSSTVPPLDFELIQEVPLTSTDLTNRVVFFTDTVLDLFRGAELYTNPNSQEGELQANAQPPLCDDLALYKDSLFYANTVSRHSLSLNLVSSSSTYINSGDYVEIKLGSTTRRYVARTGVGNNSVNSESLSGTGTVTVTYTAHGLVTGDTIYVSNVVGGAFATGTYTVTVLGANTFTITGSGTATSLTFQGVTNGTYPIFQLVPPTTSVSVGIDSTARGLVKAINRDASSTVYARYLSTASDTPGQIYLFAKGFGAAFQLRANTTTVGLAFSPSLPSSFGTTVQSTNDDLPNAVYFSKQGEPEAVPLVNQLFVGARNKQILRIFALRDSILVLKEDGVYRIDGDNSTNFTVTILDSTSICLVAASAVALNNQVFFLSNQGVSMASNSAVQIISRKIEDAISPIFGTSTLATQTFAVGYETSRFYLLSTLEPNGTTASVVYCYNTLTDAWTTWDETFVAGCVGPNDTLFLASTSNTIKKERKLANKLDHSGEDYAATVIAVATDGLSAEVSISGNVPAVGDILVYNDIISRIKTVVQNVISYTVTFDEQTNLTVAASNVLLYKAYESQIIFAPFHAGQTDRLKQFSQFQIHTRNDAISAIDISFVTDAFGGSESTSWIGSDVTSDLGWGLFPWGFEPWGQGADINLTYQTDSALIPRIYVPLYSQRATWIKAFLIHASAGESMNIQSIAYTVRGLAERVSR